VYQVDDGSGGVATASVMIRIKAVGSFLQAPPPVAVDVPPVQESPPDDPPPATESTEEEYFVGERITTDPSRPITSTDRPSIQLTNTPTALATSPQLQPPDARVVFAPRPVTRVERAARNVADTTVIVSATASVAAFDTDQLWNDVTVMRKDIQKETYSRYFAAGSAAGATSVLTVGYVLWTIRSGWLVTSLLTQLPAWQLIDPLVVLDQLDDEPTRGGRDDDDSLESLLERNESDRESNGEGRHPQDSDPQTETPDLPAGGQPRLG
jgi:hypothetical protein